MQFPIAGNNADTLNSGTFMPPPFTLFPPPYLPPPPPPIPPQLDQLSDEELRAIEGQDRQHVEERIKVRSLLFDANKSNFKFKL